ncbi:flagellar brake protein [Fictibacillus sp. NRS-1165]|uniref:flagellar brake protein n=1 Tax=Fictibacillus sp. NRS-1165 TaxID=3144463 RepID=UPI003D25B078
MFAIGDSLILEPAVSRQEIRYKCKVMELSDDQIYIDYPINEVTGKTEFFVNGTAFKATFYHQDQNVYMFQTELSGRKIDRIPLLAIQHPDEKSLVKLQRRQFIRIESMLDIAVHPSDTVFIPFTSVTSDISAGGLRSALPAGHPLKEGMRIICGVILPMNSGTVHCLKAECNVLRILEHNGKEKASVHFSSLGEAAQQNLVRYCFEQQLAEKKKLLNE